MTRALLILTTVLFAVAACGPAPEASTDLCPVPAHGPTIHDAPITADEVWRAEDGPHVIPRQLAVRAGATLQIEPCATVELDPGAGFDVAFPGTPTTGTLRAIGEAKRPIRFVAGGAAPWNHIRVDVGATVQLAHVTLEGGGALGATILASGDGTRPTHRNLFVDHVTVRDSAGVGVRLERDAGFTAGSNALTVVGAASFPLELDEHGIGGLPRGAYTGNGDDRVFIDPTGSLTESATLRNLGVPYLVGNARSDNLVIGEGFGHPLTTLTVEPGVRVEFFGGIGLEIEHATGAQPASGALIAEGTALEPIVFTSAAATPSKADWRGLWFGGEPSDANSIRHARIEYTGADCGCILVSCSNIDRYEGAVIFTAAPTRAFIADTVIRHGSSHAVVLGYTGAMVDFRAGITLDDVTGCGQTQPSAATCPSPKPSCL